MEDCARLIRAARNQIITDTDTDTDTDTVAEPEFAWRSMANLSRASSVELARAI